MSKGDRGLVSDFDDIVAGKAPAPPPQQAANDATADFDSMVAQSRATKAGAKPEAAAKPKGDEPGVVMSAISGANHAFGRAAGGITQLAGRALSGAGDVLESPMLARAGSATQKNAAEGMKRFDADNKAYEEAHPTANMVGELAGDVGSSLGVPLGPLDKLGKSANIVNRMIHGAVSGGVASGIQGVDEGAGDFWAEKLKQVGAGAVGGAAGAPAGDVLGKLGGKLSDMLGVGTRKATGTAGKRSESAISEAESKVASDANRGKSTPAAESGPPAGANGKAEPRVPDAAGAPSESRTLVVVPNEAPKLSEDLRASIKKAASEGRPLSPEAIARHIEADSFGVKLTSGQAQRDANLFSVERNFRAGNELQKRFAEQEAKLTGALDDIHANAAPDTLSLSSEDAGQHLLDSIKSVQASRRQEINAAYKKLAAANGGDLPIDGVSFVAHANEALAKEMHGAFVPAPVQAIMREIGEGKRPMTFENFENLRTILGKAQRAAERSPEGGNAGKAVSIVRDALEQVPISGEVGHVKELADQARALARAEFKREETSGAYKAVADDAAHARDFVKSHLVNEKDPHAIAALAEHLSDNPVALQEIKAGVIHHLRENFTSAGGFHAANYGKAVRKLGTNLDVIYSPAEAESIRRLGRVAETIKSPPPAHHVNVSNTEVARLQHAGEAEKGGKAAELLTGALNGILPGLHVGSGVAGAYKGLAGMTKKAEAAAAEAASTKTGAGIGGDTSREAAGKGTTGARAGAATLASILTQNVGKKREERAD